jgi:uncharacterized protein YndB with AHSA1/START domain
MAEVKGGADLVRKTVEVGAPQRTAFQVFAERMTTWWPLETHHIGSAAPAEVVIEPRVGGRCFERGVDGSECDWGRVVAWEPPARFVFTWEISPEWKADASFRTEVEVRFVALGPRRTRVELEHRHLDRYGPKQGEMRTAFDSPGGWAGILQRFAAEAEKGLA